MIKLGNAPGQIKEVDSKRRIVVGYPSTFGHIDSTNEVVDAGAYKRTIEHWGPEGRNRIKALYQHDPSWIVGRPTELAEDEIGLRATTQFTDTSMGRDVLKLIEDEVITEQSIGYDVIKDFRDDDGVLHLKELRLWEYSFVTWGANEYTPIIGVKSDNIELLRSKMERMRRKLHKLETEDIAIAMELAIKQWEDMLPRKDGKPIGPFEDWDDCIRSMTGKVDDPEAFCGALEHGKMLRVALHDSKDSPVGTPENDVDSQSLKDITSWARTEKLRRDLQKITKGN